MSKVSIHPKNSLVSISYAREEAILFISKAEYNLLLALPQHTALLEAFIQEQYNIPAHEAKSVVEAVIQSTKQMEQETDWSNVPAGTLIYVRDKENYCWSVQVFVEFFDDGFYNKFYCSPKGRDSVFSWKYAKLIPEIV